jgi:tetratricopeptide (TPR) repeat protein
MTDLRTLEKDALGAQRRGEYPAAIKLWSRLLSLQSNWEHGYPHYYLADCYVQQGEFDEAEKHYVEAVNIAPSDSLFTDALTSLRAAREAGHLDPVAKGR